MARIFSTGAAEVDFSSVWAAGSEGKVVFRGESPMADPRTGFACWQSYNDSGLRKILPSGPKEIYIGFALNMTDWYYDRALFVLGDGTAHIEFRVRTNGSIRIQRGSTFLGEVFNTIILHNWHYVEVHLRALNTGGIIELKVDGNLVFTYEGDCANGAEDAANFRLYGPNGYDVFYDDIVVNDTTGTENNSWPGQVHLLPLRPRGAGSASEWDRVGVDLGANYAQLRGPNAHTSALQAASAGLVEKFLVDTVDLPSGVDIKNILINPMIRQDSGTSGVKFSAAYGASVVESDTFIPSAAWIVRDGISFPVNPSTGLPWADTDFVAAEFGFESV